MKAMFPGRGRSTRGPGAVSTPVHPLATKFPPASHRAPRMPAAARAPLARPEPDYEVVEFPSEDYVNAKLQPPAPPPRPATGHPAEAGASCGLCGGGGARVRCTECGRRALCASCDDMYHRHPKRRHHQRQALSPTQLLISDVRPPLPPKVAAPVPPPRRHKMGNDRASASPRPPTELRHASLGPVNVSTPTILRSPQPMASNVQNRTQPMASAHLGNVPYLSTASMQHIPQQMVQPQMGHNNHLGNTLPHQHPWARQRSSLPGPNMPPNPGWPSEHWENADGAHSPSLLQNWGPPMRRGASVLELGGAGAACGGCGHCAPTPSWRYGSCASLDHQWAMAWPPCCPPPPHHALPHRHPHSHTPQPYRRAESRTVSRAASRAVSPAMSTRSRASRRSKYRTPSPPSLPSSDADSESESETEPAPSKLTQPTPPPPQSPSEEDSLGPPPPPPDSSWQCEHCTYVNEPGVRVCIICCKTPTAAPKPVMADLSERLQRTKVADRESPASPPKRDPVTKQNGRPIHRLDKEKSSTGCGPSPPRDIQNSGRKSTHNRKPYHTEQSRNRHEITIGPSPPRALQYSPTPDLPKSSPVREKYQSTPPKEVVQRHSVSVGPSPPRDARLNHATSNAEAGNFPKKSIGTSPPRDNSKGISSVSPKQVSNTGTSPPPQSISTQTYEVPNSWERAPSATRSRSRRKLRDDERRERSHSRHSLSSDTRESERSVRTSGGGGGGRWEWRSGRDSSPESERRRLTRRASHLDLHRPRPTRNNHYGSEAPSPEPMGANRTLSLEHLVGAGSRREAERGLELARLLTAAERLGFSAAEVHAALAQNPLAPLAWLRERWPSLCAGVRAAAARLAPGADITEMEARAALARHRGAMWPAVTDCVERHRKMTDVVIGSEEGRLRGRVWGSPTGADDESAPPALSRRPRAQESSDEFDELPPKLDDDWMYLPLDGTATFPQESYEQRTESRLQNENEVDHITQKLKLLLTQSGFLQLDEDVAINNLMNLDSRTSINNNTVTKNNRNSLLDFSQSESEFIDAYNALTRLSPLPSSLSNGTEIKKTYNASNFINSKDSTATKTASSTEEPDTTLVINNNNIEIKNSITTNIKNNGTIGHDNSLKLTNSEIFSNKPNSQNLNEKQNIVNSNEYTTTSVQRPEEDRSNNLSEIVDSTQKIIQQMKDEINSDINSLDDRNSVSDSENSSNDEDFSSEHESTYSNTEERSEDETSEHSETSFKGIPVDNKEIISSQINRTSSEENDQFEEALDHINEQVEDIKNSNFEVLSSIARSLQEDRTISVELVEQTSKESIQTKRHDFNNNFAAVSSFEEIYDELNLPEERSNPVSAFDGNRADNNSQNIPPSQNANTKNSKQVADNIKNAKQEILLISQDPKLPTKLEISESIPTLLNATVDEISFSQPDLNINNSNSDTFENISDVDINLPKAISDNSDQKTQNSQNLNNLPINNNDYQREIKEDDSNYNNPFSSNEDGDGGNDLKTMEVVPVSLNNLVNDYINNTIISKNPTISTKSNIPKPIRVQNLKQKAEKTVTKVISSKVPIRRTSIKQYPAPVPPKTIFANIQNGNVKQLQTRLFNKPHKLNTLRKAEPIAKDATLATSQKSKKKLAPDPPDKTNVPTTSFSNSLPTKEKKNTFFKETCRTEDEWSDSGSEDSQVRPFMTNNESEHVPRSPPPPVTVRRVSGQIIDLANVRLPEGSPERQARMLLAEGATETWEQARLAVELVSRGAEPSSALLAALECIDLNSALVYLYQDCELCASRLPEHEMISMLRCTHRCCRECARHYYTVQITERSIADCICPFCKEPELDKLSEDEWLEYFAHLDILLKTLVELDVHELFQRKLRDRTLALDPNFRWCVECSSGFFVHPKHKKLRCPECRSVSCASCRKPWTLNHDGLSCEDYAAWLEDNDPERSMVAVQQHLRDNGIECPRCHFKYSLSRGGCMHFTCTQCKYEFCYGCGKPFMMGARCGLSDYCAKLGLHAHHPRNCLFYLRDKEPHELQTLLQMNNVPYEVEAAEGSSGRCPIPLQRETPTGLVDSLCGNEVPPKHAGLCKAHYVEALAMAARTHRLDPLPVMALSELVAELRRRALPLPERGPWDTDPLYAGMCAEIVKEKIPLD